VFYFAAKLDPVHYLFITHILWNLYQWNTSLNKTLRCSDFQRVLSDVKESVFLTNFTINWWRLSCPIQKAFVISYKIGKKCLLSPSWLVGVSLKKVGQFFNRQVHKEKPQRTQSGEGKISLCVFLAQKKSIN
jgi:hypothetical protein